MIKPLFLTALLGSGVVLSPQFPAQERPRPKIVQAGKPLGNPTYRIAVIDSGFNPLFTSVKVKLCEKGSFDFRSGLPQQFATQPHGTFVAATIAQELNEVKANYCILNYQVFTDDGLSEDVLARAIYKAVANGATAINMSLSGMAYFDMEKKAIQYALSKGVAVFVAAGNDRKNLDEACVAFPACYRIPGMFIIGAIDHNWDYPESYSNFGSVVTAWYPGFFLDPPQHTLVNGTSFASPRAVAKYIYSLALTRAGK